jgi:hypothetical protein
MDSYIFRESFNNTLGIFLTSNIKFWFSISFYSVAASILDYIKQIINVTQALNVNISFWWNDERGVAGPTEKCEGLVTLTP